MKYLVAFMAFATISCASIPAYQTVRPLTYSERVLVHMIVSKAKGSDKEDYYMKKLQLLLSTPEAKQEDTQVMIEGRTAIGLKKAEAETIHWAEYFGVSVNDYTSIEELYESMHGRHWTKQTPVLFGSHYYVAADDPNDILIHIRIHLVGDSEQIKNIIKVEDNIEKHISVPGLNFNLEFVGFSGSDVFEIKADPKEWPNALNWSGGDYYVYAHELFHVMGLPDEYDRIEAHAGNKYLPIKERLQLFLMQMYMPNPPDAKLGIMSDQHNRPLDRQVCEIAGLGKDCVQARQNKRQTK